MSHDVVEEHIEIGYYGEKISNYLDFGIQIIEADSINTPDLLKLDKHTQWIVCGICWLFLFVGTYFRYFLYSLLFDSYKSKESKPIDTLILIISLIQHVSIVLFVVRLSLVVLNDVNLDQIGAQSFCIASSLIYLFDLCYSCIRSLGISLFRILYIKHDLWLKYDFGENKFLYITLVCGLCLAAVFVTLLNVHGYSHLQRENCMLHPQVQILIQWLEEYNESQGDDSSILYLIVITPIILLILVAMTLAEIMIYCVYFYHIYRHDNSERLRRHLEPEVIRKRNKRNAITFFGQFCSFVFDIGINVCLVLATATFGKKPELWVVILSMKAACFTAMSMVEVLTSSNLRSRMELPFKSKK
jgi:hypothetical protein